MDYNKSIFKVALHNPIDYPLDLAPVYLTTNSFLRIFVSVKMVTASEELRKWNPISRGCYYYNEKPLKFFNVYTQNNCEIECHANNTKDKCGCVAYYHPS